MNMNMTVPFMTYFGDSINSKLPDEIFGIILSFLDLNAYTLMCRLNAYLRIVPENDWKHLLWVDNVADTYSKHFIINSKISTIHINSSILVCFINIMTCMPLLYKPAKTKKLVGYNCKHRIENALGWVGIMSRNMLDIKNKRLLNGVQRYTTDGTLRIKSGIIHKYGSYVDRLSTVIALIVSGFKRDCLCFYIADVRPTAQILYNNRHLTVNKPIGYDPALTF